MFVCFKLILRAWAAAFPALRFCDSLAVTVVAGALNSLPEGSGGMSRPV